MICRFFALFFQKCGNSDIFRFAAKYRWALNQTHRRKNAACKLGGAFFRREIIVILRFAFDFGCKKGDHFCEHPLVNIFDRFSATWTLINMYKCDFDKPGEYLQVWAFLILVITIAVWKIISRVERKVCCRGGLSLRRGIDK